MLNPFLFYARPVIKVEHIYLVNGKVFDGYQLVEVYHTPAYACGGNNDDEDDDGVYDDVYDGDDDDDVSSSLLVSRCKEF